MLCALHAIVWHSSKTCCLEHVGSDLTLMCHELHFFCCLLQSFACRNTMVWLTENIDSRYFPIVSQSVSEWYASAFDCIGVFYLEQWFALFLGVHERPLNECWLGVTALFLMIPQMPQIYLCSVYMHSSLLSVDHCKTKIQNNSEKHQRSPTVSNSQLIFSYLCKNWQRQPCHLSLQRATLYLPKKCFIVSF